MIEGENSVSTVRYREGKGRHHEASGERSGKRKQ